MVYKIRIILDSKENIFRDVEIKENQTLWNLHLGIKSAFSLQGDELSTFNVIDNQGVVLKSVPMEDMSDDGDGEIMSDVYIKEVFEKIGDKTHFQYGLLDLWEFFCELIEVNNEKPAVNYPITVFRFGKVPLKAPERASLENEKNKFSSLMDDAFLEDDALDGEFDDDFDDEFDAYDD